MNGNEILQSFRARGLIIKVKGNNLEVSPRSLITEKIRAFINKNKLLILAALRNYHSKEVVTCHQCAHFIPDSIGKGGIGTCSLGDDTWLEKCNPMPPWPHAKRNCVQFVLPRGA